MATMLPFAGLNGDGLQSRLAGAAARSARPVPAAVTVRRLEPLAPVFLGLHGVMVLVNLGGRGPAWMVPVRGLTVLVVGLRAGGAPGPPGRGPGPGRGRPRLPGRLRGGGRSVLAGELMLFRCRYRAPGGADPCEITVTPLADGDGAVVTHRPAPEPHGAAPVR